MNDAVASTNFVVSNCKVMSGCSTIWGLSRKKKSVKTPKFGLSYKPIIFLDGLSRTKKKSVKTAELQADMLGTRVRSRSPKLSDETLRASTNKQLSVLNMVKYLG